MTTINGHEIHTPGPLKAETFAAFTGHGTEYGVTFYDADLPEGEAGDSYGDLITMVDERNDADPARIEQAQAETMRFATEIVRRWNAYPDILAALEEIAAVFWPDHEDCRYCDAPEGAEHDPDALCAQTRAAIAKARGQ